MNEVSILSSNITTLQFTAKTTKISSDFLSISNLSCAAVVIDWLSTRWGFYNGDLCIQMQDSDAKAMSGITVDRNTFGPCFQFLAQKQSSQKEPHSPFLA